MQNPVIYSNHNKSTTKYKIITKVLKENGHLLRWGTEERVLDAGCGPGDVTAYILRPLLPPDFRFLLGVDISPSMIEFAQRTHAGDRMAFVILDIGTDISKLPENNKFFDGFDKIFSFFVLHWIEDLGKCMQNIYTLLRPGGQAFLSFPIDRRFQKTYQQVRSQEQWKEYFKDVKRVIPAFPSGDAKCEFETLSLNAGFDVVKCELTDLYAEYESIEAFKGLVESLDPDLSCVPTHLKTQYLNDCVEVIQEAKALEKSQAQRTVLFRQASLLCILQKA